MLVPWMANGQSTKRTKVMVNEGYVRQRDGKPIVGLISHQQNKKGPAAATKGMLRRTECEGTTN